MPALLSLLYPCQPDARFDEADYFGRHLPLVRERWEPLGLTGIRVVRGVSTLEGGSPAYRMMAFVSFTSVEAVRDALGKYREEIFASIRRYTDIQPIVQISEELI